MPEANLPRTSSRCQHHDRGVSRRRAHPVDNPVHDSRHHVISELLFNSFADPRSSPRCPVMASRIAIVVVPANAAHDQPRGLIDARHKVRRIEDHPLRFSHVADELTADVQEQLWSPVRRGRIQRPSAHATRAHAGISMTCIARFLSASESRPVVVMESKTSSGFSLNSSS